VRDKIGKSFRTASTSYGAGAVPKLTMLPPLR
jgi:hypothetical protein